MATSIIDELKDRARRLQRAADRRQPAALARLRKAEQPTEAIKRRHCLATIARELGFNGWPVALHALSGDPVEDFGTLLYPDRSGARFNIWSASYEEARAIRQEHGGYLLAYRHQFLVVDADYIRSLGLDPEDSDWEAMGRDWVRPVDPSARSRLYAQLIRTASESAMGSSG